MRSRCGSNACNACNDVARSSVRTTNAIWLKRPLCNFPHSVTGEMPLEVKQSIAAVPAEAKGDRWLKP
jgi:hypothetical protein